MILEKYIGDKNFYKKVMRLAVPIMIQNGITNFVNMIDNIMVGRIGTEQMSGVAIVNQLLFVFNLCIFGATAGIGIFTAQYYGKDDTEGIRHTFRLKLIAGGIITVTAIVLFTFMGKPLINAFIHEGSKSVNLDLAFSQAEAYLKIMLFGLIPMMISQVYAGTLRETEKPLLPMAAGIAAVLVNLSLNYLLIFGTFGFPKLGVRGAAIATVVSRIVECSIIIVFTHCNSKENPFIIGIFTHFSVPLDVAKRIIPKAIPLLVNETLWAGGMALLTRCYSMRGLAVVAASNICSTIINLFLISLMAFGDSIAIIVGGLLGAGKVEEAKDTDRKLVFFSFSVCVVLGIIMALTAHLFPLVYNTTDEVRTLAASFILCYSVYLPLNSIINSCYFTLRSGGKTVITFLFDSVYMICVCVTFTYILAKYTALPIVAVYAGSLAIEVFKAIIGIILVRRGAWINNLVSEHSSAEKDTCDSN